MTEQGPLKVIGAGFGRTGTLSLKLALESVGYKCHHAHAVSIEHKEQAEIFYDILSHSKQERIDKKLWNKLLIKPYNYTATVDWPTSFYFDELLQQNPSAKVILSIRDNGEKWYNSAKNSIYKNTQVASEWPVKLFLYFTMDFKMRKGLYYAFGKTIWDNPQLFDGNFEDKNNSIKIYNQWIEHVKKTVPSDKLLVWNVKEGWEPICSFLKVERPEKYPQFPRSNS
eukprot:UN12763